MFSSMFSWATLITAAAGSWWSKMITLQLGGLASRPWTNWWKLVSVVQHAVSVPQHFNLWSEAIKMRVKQWTIPQINRCICLPFPVMGGLWHHFIHICPCWIHIPGDPLQGRLPLSATEKRTSFLACGRRRPGKWFLRNHQRVIS